LGRLRATVLVAAAGIGLSALPDVVTHAQRWIVHLGNAAAPLAGVILADYVVRKRRRLDVAAPFDPGGPVRHVNGVNVAGVAAIAAGVAVYSGLPEGWLKVAWGLAAAGGGYLALAGLERALRSRAAVRPALD